eukprot:8864690-Alexandrium_andersonii.AAC.1
MGSAIAHLQGDFETEQDESAGAAWQPISRLSKSHRGPLLLVDARVLEQEHNVLPRTAPQQPPQVHAPLRAHSALRGYN